MNIFAPWLDKALVKENRRPMSDKEEELERTFWRTIDGHQAHTLETQEMYDAVARSRFLKGLANIIDWDVTSQSPALQSLGAGMYHHGTMYRLHEKYSCRHAAEADEVVSIVSFPATPYHSFGTTNASERILFVTSASSQNVCDYDCWCASQNTMSMHFVKPSYSAGECKYLLGASWASGEACQYEDDGYTSMHMPSLSTFGISKEIGLPMESGRPDYSDHPDLGAAIRMLTLASNNGGRARGHWYFLEGIHAGGDKGGVYGDIQGPSTHDKPPGNNFNYFDPWGSVSDEEEEDDETGENDKAKEEIQPSKLYIEGGDAMRKFPKLKNSSQIPHPSICVGGCEYPGFSVGAQRDHGVSPRHALKKTLDLVAPLITKKNTSTLRALVAALDGWQAKVKKLCRQAEPPYSDCGSGDDEEEDEEA